MLFLLIPINMKDGCIIGRGLGNSDWNESAPHGAGRLMSRAKAKASIPMEDYRAAMEWNRIKHPREIVKIGDKLDVYVKSFDPEKKRVSLGCKKEEDNPWNKFVAEYHEGDVVDVTIVSITPFGAFAQIIPGVDGLIHISQISTERINNVCQLLYLRQEYLPFRRAHQKCE